MMRYIYTLLILLGATLQVNAVSTKEKADSAYAKEDYQRAIALYESMLKSNESAEIYYNLGNAFYRTDNITRSIICYERALLLQPGDADINFNLQLARSKTIDKIEPESQMFFVTWYKSFVNLLSVDGWAHTAIIMLVLALVAALVYLFVDTIWIRKVGFFGGVLALLLFIVSNVMAKHQQYRLDNRDGAIVISSSVAVKSSPSQGGTTLFVLHEGTKVTITDDSMKEWKEVRIADGKTGWISKTSIEVI